MFYVVAAMEAAKRRVGQWYVLPRQKLWWSGMVLKEWDNERWRKFFRVDKHMFWNIEQDLSPLLAGTGCNFKEPISVEFKVAAYFLRMSTGASFRHISELLGIGFSTAIWHCWMVAQALVHVYRHLISEARYDRSLEAIQVQFRVTGHGWLGVVGAIDCTHVKIAKPDGPRGKRWKDRNSQFFIIVQAVVAPDRRFYDVFVGFPGAPHDQHVFAESPLGKAFRAGTHRIQKLLPIPFRRALVRP